MLFWSLFILFDSYEFLWYLIMMLQSLKIQNIALIPQVEIEFSEKFNVLTGETGAGKSIIIGSFNFILGEKLSKSVIRSGASSARVDAVFSVSGAVTSDITALTGIDFEDNTVILTRTLKVDGKSECRINGNVVTTSALKDAAAQLIHIHGQHETEVLLKAKNHLSILDGFGRINLGEYHEQYDKLLELRAGLKSFGGSDAERDRLVDMYQYQIKEIESAKLRDNEDEELLEFKTKMINFEKIYNNLSVASQAFKELGFRNIISLLSGVAKLDVKIEKMLDRAKSVQYELDDVESGISSYLEGLEYDEEKFKTTDERLDEIKVLKRKYGGTIPQIFVFLAEARASLDFLTRSVEDMDRIKLQISDQEKVVAEAGERLTQARKAAAVIFEHEIVNQLKDLGMPACKLRVEFNAICAGAHGCDEVEFLFSANAGEEIKPLASIISGGEMSRFMLALKTVTARFGSVATMVFDEIDTGVGGMMGTRIAEKMKVLSGNTQVICVTHLPQIAAIADTHFLIKKTEDNNRTVTNIKILRGGDKSAELSRMLGLNDDLIKMTTNGCLSEG